MNKKNNKQGDICLGELPTLLKNGKVFKALGEAPPQLHQQYMSRYKTRIYEKMDEMLGDLRPKSINSYKKWFSNPEKYLNDAFLTGQKQNPEKWLLIVNTMTFVLQEILAIAIIDARTQVRWFDEKDKQLSTALLEFENLLKN